MNPTSISNSTALLFLFFTTLVAAAADIAINCGSGRNPTLINGRKWQGDELLEPSSTVQLNGSSTTSTILAEKSAPADEEEPYTSSRISRSRFHYSFQLNNPGQKIIRLHFKPAPYRGFHGLKDFFTVEAGAFTLLSNFSASLTAESLGVNFFVKEFCLYLQEEDEQLDIVFYPAPSSPNAYAFINGIEIISEPSDVSYYHGGGDAGVHLVGQKLQIHVDYGTALERVHRLIAKHTFVKPNGGDFDAMLPIRATGLKNSTWRVPVDIGFRYLIRLHLSEIGLKIARSGEEVFKLFIDGVIVDANAVASEGTAWYVDCIVRMRGQKQEIKRELAISVQPCQELIEGHDLLAAVEILKLSNNENSLAGPNLLPPAQVSVSQPQNVALSSVLVLGRGNVVVTLAVIVISLVSIVVQKLGKISEAYYGERGSRAGSRGVSEANLAEEGNKPSVRAQRVCRHFSLDEIKLATMNFDRAFFIGKGGFGKVYKGLIDDGKTTVAIKRLKAESSQGSREFLTEIETLSEVRHFNLLSLIGYCNEHREMILVYEYMSGGSLVDHLYKLSKEDSRFSYLNWNQRLNICIGAARGLDYLHTGLSVIHRDVKPSNILLDENFVAKVSDFGLAKEEDGKKVESHVITQVKGTPWYVDPHYKSTKKLTRKSDTYSFGVVLLEALCGRPAEDLELTEDEQVLTRWARDNIDKGTVDKIVASTLRNEISRRSLKTYVGLVERCLDGDPKKRPTMAQVVLQLESLLEQSDETYVSDSEINETTTVSTWDLKPPPIDQTTFEETTHANEVLFTTNEAKREKKSRLSRFLPWKIRWSKLKLSSKDEMFAGTSLYVKSKLTHLFQRRQKANRSNPAVEGTDIFCRRLSLSEILTATCNFDELFLIGRGGFGNVYKGLLDKGTTTVAVKRLTVSSRQGGHEFITEIQMLSKVRHINLVSLVGYCNEKGEMILAYDYMARGTLREHLYGSKSSSLGWLQRLQICLDAAKGLNYLHHGIDHGIIHRDVKSSNILLDQNWVAKVSDFGLATLGPNDSNTHISTQVKGTMGYLDPDYFIQARLTQKSDVYSFGVVLLEVLCARAVCSPSLPSDQVNLVQWALTCHRKGKVDQIIDPNLNCRISPDCLKKFLGTALKCVQVVGSKRPTMADVEWDLAHALKLQMATDIDSNSGAALGLKDVDTITSSSVNWMKT